MPLFDEYEIKYKPISDKSIMDSMDSKLLIEHQNFPSLPMTELAGRIGLSHTACWKRLKRMEEDGVISGRAVILNQKALGLAVTVVVQIKIEQHIPENLDAFENAVQNIPEIVTCYSMSGDSDYTLHVVAQSIEDYEVFMKRRISKLPHVASIKSSFALKQVKKTTKLPIR